MMNLIDSIAIHRYHLDRIKTYGADSPKVVGWKTEAGQLARYRALCEIGHLSNCSVLDAGCGHGDLSAYLEERFTGLRYSGIDQLEALLDVAIKKHGHLPDTAFFLGDFSAAELPATDYILACGALSYRNSDPEFVLKTINRLFNTCRIGFGFNLLTRVEHPNGILVAYDPEKIMAHCRSLTPHVVLKEGYYEGDFTVLMYR